MRYTRAFSYSLLLSTLMIQGGALPPAFAQSDQGSTAARPSQSETDQKMFRLLMDPPKWSSTSHHVQKLLDAGVDPNARDSQGNTLLHYAKDPETVKLLLARGADPRAKGDNDVTPLHKATNPKVMKLLLEAGADPHAQTQQGNTPLHWCQNPEGVKLLLGAGANPNVQDAKGKTPLHKATDPNFLPQGKADPKVIKLLLGAGADPHAKDNNGHSSYDLAGKGTKKVIETHMANHPNAPTAHK